MPKKSKKFIDKKSSASFQLVHRSQKDPLIADENAPKKILQPIINKNQGEGNLDSFGVYFDEEYDYLKHIKPANNETELIKIDPPIPKKTEKTKVSLPSSVFASHVEEPVGLLEKAAQKPGLDLSLDPDVVAAMDSDYEPGESDEEFFDDNFIARLDGRPMDGGNSDEDDSMDGDYDDSDEYEGEELDEVGSLKDDVKSRFTEYSMTSSVIHRNEQLRLLDDKFEQLYAGYDENEIGALDCEEIEGFLNPENEAVQQLAEEYERDIQKVPLDVRPATYISGSESDEGEHELIEVKEREKWDCESILSTYSNLYNHPKLIDVPPKIRINPRTGIPEVKKKLTAKALSELNASSTVNEPAKPTGPGSLVSMVSVLSIRPKGEPPEDRKSRKASFRLYKKERRIEKKLNTKAFKEEKQRMEKMMAHNKSKNIIKVE